MADMRVTGRSLSAADAYTASILHNLIPDIDVIDTDDGQWLLLPAHPALVDCLACLLAESEDLKDDGTAEDDDPAEDENDGEPDWAVGDLEPDDWAYPTIDYPTDAAEAQTAPLIGL